MPVSKISFVRDIIMPLTMGLCAAALTAAIGFLWNMNEAISTVAIAQQYHAQYLGTLYRDVEELRQTGIRTQLEVARVESQCMMLAESQRKRN